MHNFSLKSSFVNFFDLAGVFNFCILFILSIISEPLSFLSKEKVDVSEAGLSIDISSEPLSLLSKEKVDVSEAGNNILSDGKLSIDISSVFSAMYFCKSSNDVVLGKLGISGISNLGNGSLDIRIYYI